MKWVDSGSWKYYTERIGRCFLLVACCCLVFTQPARAGRDIPWNFLFTLAFLDEHRSEIIEAISFLISQRNDALLNSEDYHRMLIMRPREKEPSQVSRNAVPPFLQPGTMGSFLGAPTGYGSITLSSGPMGWLSFPISDSYAFSQCQVPSQNDLGEMYMEDMYEENVLVTAYPTPKRRKGSVRFGQLRFFIEEKALESELNQSTPESGTPGSISEFSPLGRSPANLPGVDTGLLYQEHREKGWARRKRSTGASLVGNSGLFTSGVSTHGWYIKDMDDDDTVEDCETLDLLNKDMFGEAYREYACRRRYYPSQPEPANRSADFIEVFVRVQDYPEEYLDHKKQDRAYINEDMLCIVTSDDDREYEFCIRFHSYEPLSLFHLAKNRIIPVKHVVQSEEKEFERRIEAFLQAFEQVASSERYNEADVQKIDVPGLGEVTASCIGRGQCKAVIEFTGLFQGLAFSWYRGHSLESAGLMVGLQRASLAVFEEIAVGINTGDNGWGGGIDQIKKPSLYGSTRAPSEYKIIPSPDGTYSVVEIQHRIAPENLAQTYLKLMLTNPLGHQVPIPVKYQVEIDDRPVNDPDEMFDRGRKKSDRAETETSNFPIEKIMYRIIKEVIRQLVQFTESLNSVRSLENIPVGIGIDSKLHNYRVDFLLRSSTRGPDSFDVNLKNFDNEPPNLKLLEHGEPLYRGGPLYDMISEVFPNSRLQQDFVDRVQKITGLRKLLIKLLVSIASDYQKYQLQTQINFQWFLDVVNIEMNANGLTEDPITLEEVQKYMENSQQSHKAFRLYLWACHIAARVYPGRFKMPAAYIPVNHDQKRWLDDVHARYEAAVTGLVTLNQFDQLHILLQQILNDEPVFKPVAALHAHQPTHLESYMARIQHMLRSVGASINEWLHPDNGEPRLQALESAIIDFVTAPDESLSTELGAGYQSYCLHAELPLLNQGEHQLLHDWHRIWRQVRMQCRLPPQLLSQPPACLSQGCDLFAVLGYLQKYLSSLQISMGFHSAQAAVASLFALTEARAEALIRRVQMASRDIWQSDIAAQNLEHVRSWFASSVNGEHAENYDQLSLFAGLLMEEGRLYVYEFPDGIFSGITELGMTYDEHGYWIPFKRFIPQGGVDFQNFTPTPTKPRRVLFHIQSAGHDLWHSVSPGTPVSLSEPDDGPNFFFKVKATPRPQQGQHNKDYLKQYTANLNTFLMATRMRRVNIARDGACLYHAVGRVLGFTAGQVKNRILALLQTIRHKYLLNLEATDNQQPTVVAPYTDIELFLMNWFGPMLDELDEELNMQGLWNDFNMILLAANAFDIPIIYIAPSIAPIIQPEHAQLNLIQVAPGQQPVNLEQAGNQQGKLAQALHGPLIFFEGETAHWDVAEAGIDAQDSLLAGTLFSTLSTQGLATTLLFMQMGVHGQKPDSN